MAADLARSDTNVCAGDASPRPSTGLLVDDAATASREEEMGGEQTLKVSLVYTEKSIQSTWTIGYDPCPIGWEDTST